MSSASTAAAIKGGARVPLNASMEEELISLLMSLKRKTTTTPAKSSSSSTIKTAKNDNNESANSFKEQQGQEQQRNDLEQPMKEQYNSNDKYDPTNRHHRKVFVHQLMDHHQNSRCGTNCLEKTILIAKLYQ